MSLNEIIANNKKLKIIYIRGSAYAGSQTTECNKVTADLAEQLQKKNQPYKIYNGCSLSFNANKLVEDIKTRIDLQTTIYLHGHGKIINDIHHLSVLPEQNLPTICIEPSFNTSKSSIFMPTTKTLDILFGINHPLHLELLSCYAGTVMSNIVQMPIGSSLTTHSSSSSPSLTSSNSEELLGFIKKAEYNRFSNYVITIMLSSEQVSSFAIQTANGLKKFSVQLPKLICSKAEISLWQKNEIDKLKNFYLDISNKLPTELTQQIGTAIKFIENDAYIERIQQENINRIQELNLLSAISVNNKEQVQCLLNYISPDISTIFGTTALHRATVHGYTTIVKYLIDAGVNVNQTKNNGDTALHIAVKNEYQEISQMLIDA